MSYQKNKIVLRTEIKKLQGLSTNEAYKYFKDILGPADDIWEQNGEVEAFYYEGTFQSVINNNSYGLEQVIYENDSNYSFALSFDSNYIKDKAKEFKALDPDIKEEDIKLHVYGWYNGLDEPRLF